MKTAISDGIRLVRNLIVSVMSEPPTSLSGVELDATSDDNTIVNNESVGNILDVIDNGFSNCWRQNHFETGAVPTNGCP